MKRTVLITATLALTAGVALAEIAPGDVNYQDGAISASLTGVAGDPENGRKVMTTRGLGNCIACHEVTALADFPFHGEIGPSLDGTGSRWEEAELRGIIANAKMMFEGTMMPAFYKTSGFVRPGRAYTGKAAEESELTPLLSAQQIEDVVAYLLTLKDE
jgi:sulfur-oxidizing protein SoxX